MFDEETRLWNRLPFIGRLFVTASFALLIAAFVMLLVSARQEVEVIQSDLHLQLSNELETLPATLAETVVIGDFSTLQQTLDRFVKRPIISRIIFRDNAGTILESIDPPPKNEAPQWFNDAFDIRDISGTVDVVVGGRAYGRLEIFLSAATLVNRAWTRLIHHLEILFLAISLDVIGIWLVLRQGLAPLRSLLTGVRHFSVTHEPVEVSPGGSAEIRQLILAFNEMATEVAYSQHELRAAKDTAESANIAKSRFLATMSHEIRTPMNGILGMAQILMMPNLPEEERLEFSQTILDSGQTLLTLLNDILDLSKVEAGKMKLELQPFSPQSILRDVTTLFSEPAAQKGIVLTTTCQTNDVGYIGDPLRIRQMLNNLVSNALKFTVRGAISIEVKELACDTDTATLEFAVTDSGIGIPPDKLNLLFKPFSQTDSSTTRQFGGTGLGLSIVKNLAELMGGNTQVSSQLGHGSRFSFTCTLGIRTDG